MTIRYVKNLEWWEGLLAIFIYLLGITIHNMLAQFSHFLFSLIFNIHFSLNTIFLNTNLHEALSQKLNDGGFQNRTQYIHNNNNMFDNRRFAQRQRKDAFSWFLLRPFLFVATSLSLCACVPPPTRQQQQFATLCVFHFFAVSVGRYFSLYFTRIKGIMRWRPRGNGIATKSRREVGLGFVYFAGKLMNDVREIFWGFGFVWSVFLFPSSALLWMGQRQRRTQRRARRSTIEKREMCVLCFVFFTRFVLFGLRWEQRSEAFVNAQRRNV